MEPNRPTDEGVCFDQTLSLLFWNRLPRHFPSLLPVSCFFPKTNLDYFPCFLFISILGGVCGGGNRLVVIVTAVPSYSTWILSDIHSDSTRPPTSDCLAFTNALINHTASNDSLLLPPRLITQLVQLEKVCNIKTACWPGRNTEESGDPGMFNQPLAISEPNTLGLLGRRVKWGSVYRILWVVADGSGKRKLSSCGDGGELDSCGLSREEDWFAGFKEKEQGLVRMDWPAFSPWVVWILSAQGTSHTRQ